MDGVVNLDCMEPTTARSEIDAEAFSLFDNMEEGKMKDSSPPADSHAYERRKYGIIT